MSTIFGIQESSGFARALASGQGVKVKEIPEIIEPYSKPDGTIVVGTPSLYNHDEYMGVLHREISKQMKDMRFFHEVETKDPMDNLVKSILQSVRTEAHLSGTYEGRDRDLSRAYRRSLDAAGGLQELIGSVSRINKTAGALLCIGNELRNDFQGYSHAEIPEEIKEDYERLKHIKKQWLELNSKESLETLLKQIKGIQEDAAGNGEGPTDDSKGDSEDSDGLGESHNGSRGEPKGSPEGTGEPDGGQEESDGSDSGAEDSSGKSSGNSEGSGDPDRESGEGQETVSDGEPEAKGSPQESNGSSGESSEGTPSDSFGVGAGDVSDLLKDIGMIKEASDGDVKPRSDAPYVPGSQVNHIDLTKESQKASGYVERITETLGTFTLTKKVRKYLTVMSQTGYMYGQKQGKICSKSISRLYTGQNQPRIFKTKASSKIEEDSAVFILGDASGSMSGEKYTISSSCQIAMSEVLQSLHIAHMMMQFSTEGKTRAHYIMKRFDEAYVSRDKLISRYGSQRIYLRDNVDGEAVTEAAQMLAKRPEKKKLLVVLSDGRPAWNYAKGNDSEYLKDTVKAIEDSKVMSIVGIGIQSRYVERFYKNNKVVDQLDQLERVLIDLLSQNVLR